MSFGDGNLRERARELERRLASLQEANAALADYNGELRAENTMLRERVAQLESLVRDMYDSLWAVSEAWAYDAYHGRMAELGLGAGDGE